MYCTEKIMFLCYFVLINRFLVLQYITTRKTVFDGCLIGLYAAFSFKTEHISNKLL